MTDKTIQMTATGPKKMPGWYSWRHQTRDAQEAATADYKARRGPQARRRRSMERAGVES